MKPSADQLVDQWWREHGLAVLRYARRRVPAADVDDVVLQTFTTAWQRSTDVPDHPLPWLLGVARRVAANTLRSRDRRDALVAKLVSTPGYVGTDVPEDPRPAPVLSALDTLSAQDRELLTLLAWDELTPQEAAVSLECTHAALRVRLHRARQRLRRAVQDHAPDLAPASERDPS